ncbi:MAG: putative toxin-antitoxin system toxin component, PIN family [Gemmatimonadota bacterium]|nr:putative toxin-antitoxin system toxin component, PIN family [Gemmatimonadota bacterium]
MRIVLDTNVVVTGLRSPSGASAALLEQALDRRFTLLLSVPLVLEYEGTCRDPAQRIGSGLSESEVATIVSALCAVAEPVCTWFLWRPQLRDPADEMVLETAVNGNADGLVTFNWRDFGDAPGAFGIEMLSPRQALGKIAERRKGRPK